MTYSLFGHLECMTSEQKPFWIQLKTGKVDQFWYFSDMIIHAINGQTLPTKKL